MQNRELKFRVWDTQFSMFWGEREGMDFKKIAFNFYDALFEGERLSFQQFTGLTDKNGKEIYEGDLVNFYTPGHPHGPEREDYERREVWYDSDSAAFVFSKFYYDGWHGYSIYDIKDIEVVGNILENPPNER